MPSINMIAARRAEKARRLQTLKRLVYGLGAEALCLVLAVSVLSVRASMIQGRIGDLNAQLQKLGPQVNQINKLEAQTAALQPKVDTLDGAKADTLFWYAGLSSITRSLPQTAWLTSLQGGAASGAPPPAAGTDPGSAGTDPTVSIAGVTLTQSMVGETMLRMNSAPGLDHVDLAFVQGQKTGNTDTVSFQMTVHLTPQPSALAANKKDNAKGDADVQKS